MADYQKSKPISSEETYQTFKNLLEKEGFAQTAQTQEVITNPKLLEHSSEVSRLLSQGTGNRQKNDTVNQFRKFFNEVRGLKEIQSNAVKLAVELRMLRARMSYAAGRQTISEDFSIVINDCIDAVFKSEKIETQIQGFCDVFEALYAYYYYHTNIIRKNNK